MEHYPGFFIVLEGIDGSGISTQIARISQALSIQQCRRVITTKQPSTGPVGALIRQVLAKRLQDVSPETMALLFAGDRQDHLEQEIRPVLEAGGIILCDRYLWSTLAYQGLELDTAWLRQINSFAMAPDLTVLIKVSPAVSMRRIHEGRLRAELFEQETLLEKVSSNYLSLVAEANKAGGKVAVVNGEQNIEEVTAGVVSAILQAIPQLQESL